MVFVDIKKQQDRLCIANSRPKMTFPRSKNGAQLPRLINRSFVPGGFWPRCFGCIVLGLLLSRHTNHRTLISQFFDANFQLARKIPMTHFTQGSLWKVWIRSSLRTSTYYGRQNESCRLFRNSSRGGWVLKCRVDFLHLGSEDMGVPVSNGSQRMHKSFQRGQMDPNGIRLGYQISYYLFISVH